MTGIPGRGTSSTTEINSARAAVVRALERLEGSERDALEGLQDALCSYVSVLKRAGESADRVTAEVGRLVATPVTPDGDLVMTPTVRAALVDLAVDWCAAAYAREEAASGSALPDLAPPPAPESPPQPA